MSSSCAGQGGVETPRSTDVRKPTNGWASHTGGLRVWLMRPSRLAERATVRTESPRAQWPSKVPGAYFAARLGHKGVKAARAQYDAWRAVAEAARSKTPEEAKKSHPEASILKSSQDQGKRLSIDRAGALPQGSGPRAATDHRRASPARSYSPLAPDALSSPVCAWRCAAQDLSLC